MAWHPATVQVLEHFGYDHLAPHLQEVSKPFHDLAHDLAGAATRDGGELLDGPEVTVALRKLLEAKDCAVRAAVAARAKAER